jgi:tyrosyl-tRNA synthetase
MAGQRPQQCFMTPLLVGTDGSQKMSKSLGNYVGVDEPPNDIYGKVMSIPDELIMDYFELVTDVPDEELEEFRQQLSSGTINPMTLKKRLAREIVVQLYSEKEVTEADEYFEKVVQKKEVPEEIPILGSSDTFPDIRRLLVSNKLVGSMSEATRLINQGAVKIDGNKVNSYKSQVQDGSVMQVGKLRWCKIKLVPPTIPGVSDK